MNIDVHNHVLPQGIIDLVAGNPTYGVEVADNIWHGPNHGPFRLVDSWTSPAAKIEEMRAEELTERSSRSPRPAYFYELAEEPLVELARVANSGLAEYCSAYPEQLKWFAHVPLSFPDAAATILSEAIAAGAAGVMIAPSAADNRIDDPMFDPFWSAVDSLKSPVFLHPAYALTNTEYQDWGLKTVIGTPLETTVGVIRLICAGHLDRFKGIRLVAAHGGGYFPTLEGRLKKELKNVARDFAGSPRRSLVLRRANKVRFTGV